MAETSDISVNEHQQQQPQPTPDILDGSKNIDNVEPASGRSSGFICGVVEGFYGRPWTTEQRKDLFRKLKQWGMDSYIYAPKDDYKHRAYWRELYTVEEADHLTGLISAAHEQNIDFYYALSPGLDITYSSSKEISALKRKLDQVSQFGCKAFALLFDDIEPEMSKADKEIFQSFAYAQVSVTNEIYNHLNCPRFLFCPTQYCSTRAVPTVKQSEYLNTLGSKLIRNIDILWTGSKVISKILTVDDIQEITEVLKRAPVIWDNLHANDYDQKRVFLGPYSGRSPDLIPLLRGVVTNPNCEFHANAIAIQTLAFWSKCSSDTKISSSISSDIKLETENEEGICQEEAPAFLPKNVYHPRLALKNAIANWLPEFFQEKQAWGPISKPQPAVTMVMPVIPIIPSVNTCMTLTSTSTTTTTSANILPVPEVNTTQLQLFADVCSTVTNASENVPAPIMNSLVSATKVITNETLPNPVAAAVSNISIPSTIPISSYPLPIMSIKAVEDPAIGASVCEDLTVRKDSIEGETETISKPLDGDTVIENDLDHKQLLESSEKQASPASDIPLLADEEFKTNEYAEVQLDQTTEIRMVEDGDSEVKMIDLEENEVKMVDASEVDEKMIDSEDGVLNPIKINVEDQDVKVDGALSTIPRPCSTTIGAEPMECGSNFTSPKHVLKAHFDDVMMSETTSTCSGSMQVESSDTSLMSNAEMVEDKSASDKEITTHDIMLLCDLFYLPFEHGSKALQLLADFYWLKTNASVLSRLNLKKSTPGSSDAKSTGACNSATDNRGNGEQLNGIPPACLGLNIKDSGIRSEVQEWLRRSESFENLCQNIFQLARKIARCANKELCYDLFSYVWDIVAVLSLLSAFVKWLALGHFPDNVNSFTQGGYTWFSKGWKETFMSGDQEPWVFRGGLVSDLQRLIPLDAGNDLFLYKLPETSAVNLYTLRPYLYTDETSLYSICNRTIQDGDEISERLPDGLSNLYADLDLGPFLTLAPEFCILIEDNSAGVVGYACAALDTKSFIRKIEQCWIPEMCLKYPLSLLQGHDSSEDCSKETSNAVPQRVHDSIMYFHNFKNDYPASVLNTHPSLMSCHILKSVLEEDETVCKRVITVLLAALRSNGSSFGVHVCIDRSDRFLHQFYTKLGFIDIYRDDGDSKLYLGRNF
ncbi:protein O-GlcNAcase [Toxorhynchites rutilus septentrionalis]|uniref:protein O-GlcNAcase n=1 Tax=Toxorhynchites rutilus septentrionalis TaxID=329112 RepID=UPI00247A449A|nr:protein O-GlcNAcase [Toxorhynchites rutilus septentrionalis]